MALNHFKIARGLTLASQTSAPTSPVNGDVYFDGTLGFQFRQGAAWVTHATLTGTETLTNKTLTAPTISGGTHTAITSFSLRDTSAAQDVTVTATSSTALTAGRTLTLDMVNAARSVKLQGNIDLGGTLTTASSLTTSGANALTLTTTATTNATIPAGTITLVDLSTTQTFTGVKTFAANSETVGRTNGNTITQTNVGGYYTADVTANATTTAIATFVDANATLTLPAGAYLVGYHVTVQTTRPITGASASVYGEVRLTNSTNTLVGGTRAFVGADATVGSEIQSQDTVVRQAILSLTAASTDFKLRVQATVATANGDITILKNGTIAGASANDAYIWALRIG